MTWMYPEYLRHVSSYVDMSERIAQHITRNRTIGSQRYYNFVRDHIKTHIGNRFNDTERTVNRTIEETKENVKKKIGPPSARVRDIDEMIWRKIEESLSEVDKTIKNLERYSKEWMDKILEEEERLHREFEKMTEEHTKRLVEVLRKTVEDITKNIKMSVSGTVKVVVDSIFSIDNMIKGAISQIIGTIEEILTAIWSEFLKLIYQFTEWAIVKFFEILIYTFFEEVEE